MPSEVFPALVPWLMLNHGQLKHPGASEHDQSAPGSSGRSALDRNARSGAWRQAAGRGRDGASARAEYAAGDRTVGAAYSEHLSPCERGRIASSHAIRLTAGADASSQYLGSAGVWSAAELASHANMKRLEEIMTGNNRAFRNSPWISSTTAQKPFGEQIVKISSIGIGGPYNSMLRSPVLGQRLFDLFHYLRWETSVPMRLNEFAILIIGRQWRSQVEWFAHAPIAAEGRIVAAYHRRVEGTASGRRAWPRTRRWCTISSPNSPPRKKCPMKPLPAPEEDLQRSADRGSDDGRGQLRHGRDAAGDGGANLTARQGAAVRGR